MGTVQNSLLAQIPRPAALHLPAADLERYTLPLQDNAALLAAELASRQSGRAPRFATVLPVRITPQTHGRWDTAGNLAVWRMRLYSATAYSLNLGFSQYQMPEGGQMLIYDPQQKKITGPFTPADNESHNELWTPIFQGDELVIEVQVPLRRKDELTLELNYINHDFLGFGQNNSGSCNLDIICGISDGWEEVEPFREVARSVGLYSLQGNLLCSGFLVNNTQGDCTPYFLTANHCEITSNNAASVVVYWNFENSVCRQPNTAASGQEGNGKLNDFNTGAIFRASWSNSDFCLIELDDPVSESAEAFFAGWSIKDEIPQGTVASIHHPLTDEKRISLSEKITHFGFWGSSTTNPDGNHIIVPSWTTGTTQGGSSGAPLFNSQGQAIGQLHGGDAACGNTSYDAFGRLYNSWEGGGTRSSRLRDWLDPLNLGRTTMNGRDQSLCNFWVNTAFSSGTICAGSTDTLRVNFGPGFENNEEVELGGISDQVVSAITPSDPAEDQLVYLWQIKETAPAGVYTSYIRTPYDTVYFQYQIIDQPPVTPDLLTPPHQADNQALQLLLSWTHRGSGTSYELQVAGDEEFSTLLVDQEAGDTTFALSELVPDTRYYWRVRAANICGETDWAPVRSFTTANVQCHTDASTDGPITIPSQTASTITSSISFESTGTVASIEILGVDIQHRWVGDLRVLLRSPSGKEIALLDRPGFPSSLYGCDGTNVLLNFNEDIGAAYAVLENTCGSIAPAIAGTFQPIESLSALIGEPAQGTWTLVVKDQADEDGGRLIGWQLNICTIPDVVPLLRDLATTHTACLDEAVQVDLVLSEVFDSAGVALTLEETPPGASVLFSKNPALPGDTVSLVVDNLLITGSHPLIIGATDGTQTASLSLTVEIGAIPEAVELLQPTAGDLVNGAPVEFSWAPLSDAVDYRLEVARDTGFTDILHSEVIEVSAFSLLITEQSDMLYWRVWAQNDCGTTASMVSTFGFTPNGTSYLEGDQSVQVYPNPFSEQIQLRFGQPLAAGMQLRLLDISGRLLYTDQAATGDVHKTLRGDLLSPGVYLLEMRYKGQRYVQRIIKAN